MAERNLAIRLAVIDGGKVKAELTEVGEKGERSLKRIEAAARPASEGLKLVDRAANDAFAALGDATSRLGPLGTALSRIGPAGLIAGGALAGLTFGLSRLVFPVADVGEELNKLAQKTGVSVEALSKLRYAADLSDVSSESLTKALRKLSVSLFDAKIGGEEGGAALKALGIRVTEVGGPIRATEEVLLDLAEKFAAMPDSAEKAAMAVRIFGRDGLAEASKNETAALAFAFLVAGAFDGWRVDHWPDAAHWWLYTGGPLGATFVAGVVLVYGLNQGFAGSFFRVASDYYWKDVQRVQPATVQFLSIFFHVVM